MEIRPIKTRANYRATLAEIETLMAARKGTPEGDRLDVLATLVEAYEAKHFPIPPADPIEIIAFVMEQRGLTRHDLEPAIGTRARVSEVLNRRCPLTLPMIRALSTLLRVPTDLLIQPYELAA